MPDVKDLTTANIRVHDELAAELLEVMNDHVSDLDGMEFALTAINAAQNLQLLVLKHIAGSPTGRGKDVAYSMLSIWSESAKQELIALGASGEVSEDIVMLPKGGAVGGRLN